MRTVKLRKMNTAEIFKKNNLDILRGLIPNKNTPIFGRSFIDPNEPIFNEPILKLQSHD